MGFEKCFLLDYNRTAWLQQRCYVFTENRLHVNRASFSSHLFTTSFPPANNLYPFHKLIQHDPVQLQSGLKLTEALSVRAETELTETVQSVSVSSNWAHRAFYSWAYWAAFRQNATWASGGIWLTCGCMSQSLVARLARVVLHFWSDSSNRLASNVADTSVCCWTQCVNRYILYPM